ncbi:excalibur calcium-binding domain-containing protein [Asanoa ishikariensis]|nr:excalibur calcium-binding domain-containing protein [Asanoa ishikariensis]
MRHNKTPWLIGGVLLLALCCGGFGVAALSSDDNPVSQQPAAAEPAASAKAAEDVVATSRAPFGTCAEAESAGALPLRVGDPGYSRALDLDEDGQACVAATQAPALPPVKPAKPAPKPAPTIEDGIWTVGEDIPAGTYKVTEPISGSCYWAILKSGTNGSDIIENDLPSGGLPRVTINRGQDFKTNGCGTWKKVG